MRVTSVVVYHITTMMVVVVNDYHHLVKLLSRTQAKGRDDETGYQPDDGMIAKTSISSSSGGNFTLERTLCKR